VKRVLLSLVLVGLVSTPALAKKKNKNPPPEVAAPAAPAPDPEAWRATAPKPAAEKPWTPPAAKVITLSNGMPVYFVENPGLPLLSVRLFVGAGREANPAGKAGLAAITADMLDEGTTTRSATKIAEDAARLGAVLTTASGDEGAFVSLDALTGDALGPSLDLMADVALHPAFSKTEFARVQGETLSAIEEAKSEPRDAAVRTFLAQLYGKDHPYGSPAIGSTPSVKALKVDDAKKLYQTWYHAGNAAFVVTGAASEAEVKDLLEARFGKWVKGKTTRTTTQPASPLLKTRVVFVEQPGAVQSVLRIGTVGTARTSPDYFPAAMAGTIVGGMFSSRINMNLREEHGWSYGAYGGFTDSRDGGMFLVRTQVQADKTAPAVTEVLKELAAAAKTAPADTDLSMARDNVLKSLPGLFETNETTANALLDIPRYGLPPDAYAAYVKGVEDVTTAQSFTEASRFFDPAKLLVVVVGPKTVEVDDGKGGKTTVDVVQSLKDLGYELVVQ
jgi:zinc protease